MAVADVRAEKVARPRRASGRAVNSAGKQAEDGARIICAGLSSALSDSGISSVLIMGAPVHFGRGNLNLNVYCRNSRFRTFWASLTASGVKLAATKIPRSKRALPFISSSR